jgi:hypothetical protein
MDLMEKTLDVDRFLTFAALEVMLWHWDGYVLARNNFRIYHDVDAGRMVFLPHGMDQMFSNTDGPILPEFRGLVASSLLEIPEARRRYVALVGQLMTNVFTAERLTARVREIGSYVSPVFGARAPAFQSRLEQYCNLITARVRHLEQQFGPPGGKPAEFNASGVLTLTQWEPKTDVGELEFDQVRDERNKPVLYIRAKTKPVLVEAEETGKAAGEEEGETAAAPVLATVRGSWRTSVWLEMGEYRFQALMKTAGVQIDPQDGRAGVGLRTSRRRSGEKVYGDNDWKETGFDFNVTSMSAKVELVCELRAVAGEAWFDLGSLRLLKK